MSSTPVLIATGCYTGAPRGRGRGVELLEMDPQTGTARTLAGVELEDPSFVAWSRDGRLLYAVHETAPSRLSTLRLSGTETEPSLELVSSLELKGQGACHVGPGRRSGTLVVCDYGSGHVEVIGLDEDGIAQRVLDTVDHGTYRTGTDSHPHQSLPLPGTGLLAVTDLGLGSVYLYAQLPTGELDLAGEITVGRGSGPRHLAADHESAALYIGCELSGQLATALRDRPAPADALLEETRGPRWAVRSVQPASAHAGENAVSHVEISTRENHVFVANRGPDTLSVFGLGLMRPVAVAEIEVGAHPRHFARLGERILVAAQEADRIDQIAWDGRELTVAAEPLAAPSVSCIAPRP